MDRKHAMFGLAAAESGLSSRSRPHTPPFTPTRGKVRIDRADSPAPSIHPTETVSPSKRSDGGHEVPDTIIVQELVEGHPEYATDVELVYPDETEELDSNADNTSEVSDSEADASDNNIAHRMSQLHCEDAAGEANMQKARRERRLSKRSAQRKFKRTHSQTMKSDDSEETDSDAMDDHDLTSTARRLRRRTHGPDDFESTMNDLNRRGSPRSSSPTPSRPAKYPPEHRRLGTTNASRQNDAMDLSD